MDRKLAFFGCYPEVVKCALTPSDVKQYNLPPDFTKQTDTRQAKFVAKFGDLAVELDALPINVLQARIDLASLRSVHDLEQTERVKLSTLLNKA